MGRLIMSEKTKACHGIEHKVWERWVVDESGEGIHRVFVTKAMTCFSVCFWVVVS